MEDGETTRGLRIELRATGTLAGRVLDAEGEPVPEAAIFVRDEAPWRVELRTEPLPNPEYRARLNFEVERL